MLLHNNKWKITRHNTTYTLTPPPDTDHTRAPIPLRSKSPLRFQRTTATRTATGTAAGTATGTTPGLVR